MGAFDDAVRAMKKCELCHWPLHDGTHGQPTGVSALWSSVECVTGSGRQTLFHFCVEPKDTASKD